ncbi:hypothetical protein REPUB_Repub11eG0173800 [Reevesia pubescens]
MYEDSALWDLEILVVVRGKFDKAKEEVNSDLTIFAANLVGVLEKNAESYLEWQKTSRCFNVEAYEVESKNAHQNRGRKEPLLDIAFADELFSDGKVMPLKPSLWHQYPNKKFDKQSSIQGNILGRRRLKKKSQIGY